MKRVYKKEKLKNDGTTSEIEMTIEARKPKWWEILIFFVVGFVIWFILFRS